MKHAIWINSVIALLAAASVHAAEGEFKKDCTMGLAMKQHIATDCSVNWAGEDGKTYCFGNEAAKAEFLKDVPGNMGKAQIFWEQDKAH